MAAIRLVAQELQKTTTSSEPKEEEKLTKAQLATIWTVAQQAHKSSKLNNVSNGDKNSGQYCK